MATVPDVAWSAPASERGRGRCIRRTARRRIDRLILLAHGRAITLNSQGRKLFIVARDDADGSGTVRLTEMRKDYERVPPPKRFVILKGPRTPSFCSGRDQGERLMSEILKFLSAP